MPHVCWPRCRSEWACPWGVKLSSTSSDNGVSGTDIAPMLRCCCWIGETHSTESTGGPSCRNVSNTSPACTLGFAGATVNHHTYCLGVSSLHRKQERSKAIPSQASCLLWFSVSSASVSAFFSLRSLLQLPRLQEQQCGRGRPGMTRPRALRVPWGMTVAGVTWMQLKNAPFPALTHSGRIIR
eukprot:gene56624-biopygen68203